jgi:hypothetical protein
VEIETIIVFRPIGPEERQLLAASGWKRWPPRLPHQPIFYPVTNEQYAQEIASSWNVSESGRGYVTRFHVRRQFMERYQIHTVGSTYHAEWWIPSEDLEKLNENIVGNIEVIAAFEPE